MRDEDLLGKLSREKYETGKKRISELCEENNLDKRFEDNMHDLLLNALLKSHYIPYPTIVRKYVKNVKANDPQRSEKMKVLKYILDLHS